MSMLHYVNDAGELYAYETVSDREQYGTDDLRLATEDEVEAVINPTLTTDMLSDIARSRRDVLLSELDVIVSNPMRWAEFSEPEKDGLSAYRKALLDVPEQSGFPQSIEWPDIKEVLS